MATIAEIKEVLKDNQYVVFIEDGKTSINCKAHNTVVCYLIECRTVINLPYALSIIPWTGESHWDNKPQNPITFMNGLATIWMHGPEYTTSQFIQDLKNYYNKEVWNKGIFSHVCDQPSDLTEGHPVQRSIIKHIKWK